MGCFMGKKKILVLVSALFMLSSAFAGSLNFQVVQRSSNLKDVCESSLVVEDEILNYFFDAGYIVSNSQSAASVSDKEDSKLWNTGLSDSAEGSFDYFVQIKLILNNDVSSKETPCGLGNFNKLSWKLVSVQTGKVIEESSKKIDRPVGLDTEANVRDFAADFAYHLRKTLRKA